MSVSRQAHQLGRGRGSARDVAQHSQSQDKKPQPSSFRSKRNVNFDPKDYMVA